MAISLIQTKAQNGGGYVNSYTVTLTSNVTAGSLLVLGLTAGDADSISSITDNQGNAWTLVDVDAAPSARRTWLYYAKNAAAGATTITITFTGGAFPDSIAIVREYSGIDTTSPLDQTAKGHDSGYVQTHSTSASSTTTQADELVVVVGGADAQSPTWALGSGYSNLTAQGGFDLYTSGVMEDKIISSTGSQTGSFSTTSYVQGQAVLATFKATVAVVSKKSLMLIGVG